MLKIRALLMAGAATLCLPIQPQAQSPIPESRVPGFGGSPNQGAGPSGVGSAVGSNVGAGATASPVADPTPPNVAPSIAESPPPLVGASRPLPLPGPATK